MTDDPSYRRDLANALCLLGLKLGELHAKLDYALKILDRLNNAATGTTQDKSRKRHAAARSMAANDIDGSKQRAQELIERMDVRLQILAEICDRMTGWKPLDPNDGPNGLQATQDVPIMDPYSRE